MFFFFAKRILLPLLLLLAGAGAAPGRAGETHAGTDPLVEASRTIAERLETLLGIDYKRPVEVRVIDRAELHGLLEREMLEQVPPERVAVEEAAFARFGLLPEGFDLRGAYLDLMGGQVAGFYLPRTRSLYLIRGMPLPSMITAHELTHALQDQHFDLKTLMDARKNDGDSALALQSVFEGEAMLTMAAYMARHGEVGEMLVGSLSSFLAAPGQQAQLGTMPLLLRQALLFPYFKGQLFVARAFRNGGYAAVRALYADLPESSEQILFPAKYYEERDRPTRFDLDGLAETLGAGWREAGTDRLGAFGVGILLESLGLQADTAREAAAGWDGDRWVLLRKEEPSETSEALLWLSTWDSPAHAYRFRQAYGEALTRRWGAGTRSGAREGWTDGAGRGILLIRWGREVLFLDGFGPEATRKARAFLTARKRSGALFAADHREDGEPEGWERSAPATDAP